MTNEQAIFYLNRIKKNLGTAIDARLQAEARKSYGERIAAEKHAEKHQSEFEALEYAITIIEGME